MTQEQRSSPPTSGAAQRSTAHHPVLAGRASAFRVRRSQAERRDESGRLLVEAMLKVVAEQGVNAATFEEIGRQARLSRSLVTQRFGSKRGLVEAVINYLHRKREAVMHTEESARAQTLRALTHFIDEHLGAAVDEHDSKAYFMLLASTVADATSLRDLFAHSHERVRVGLRTLLEQGKIRDEIRDDVDSDALALTIGSLLLGANIQRLIDPTTDTESIRRAINKMLRSALSRPRAR